MAKVRQRRADKDLYNKSAEDFIPVACHYDENTLLTKNGEIIQVIQVNGINAEQVSDKLFNLREVVRGAIKNNIGSNNFAFWIHTVRRKTNLDDMTPYEKLLSANIHNLWRRKNYWDDKYVNTLYISIVYDAAGLKVNNFNALVNSLFYSVVTKFHDKYFETAVDTLNRAVNGILADLQEYGAVKLGVKFDGENSYSEQLFLYRRIIHLNEQSCLVPLTDLATALATHQYAVGSDKIEVIDEEGKKFAAIISIKEYQEVAADALDRFLQVPVEMIATEVFYFVDKKDVTPVFAEQNYLLRVSGDEKLAEMKGITDIINADETEFKQFCHQQISITIIGENLSRLDEDLRHASEELEKIGIVHVKEDINLEQTFWAQLPGNFSFLRRMSPTILKNTSALASLHNFPAGDHYSVWGRAVTLLRTERGTPYFMNFHNGGRGNTCIFSCEDMGKTVLMNFLISEATKFNPTIIYLTTGQDAKIFVEGIEGRWIEREKNIINPLICKDSEKSRDFVYNFLRIICDHFGVALTEEEQAFLVNVTNIIFTLEEKDRNLTYLIKNLDFTQPGGESIKTRLAVFAEGGLYHGMFDGDSALELSESDVVAFNIFHLTDEYFESKFFPSEKKLIDQFNADLSRHGSVRAGLIYALHYLLTSLEKDNPKILAVENLGSLFNHNFFTNMLSELSEKMSEAKGVIIGDVNLTRSAKYFASSAWHVWYSLIDTSFILALDIIVDNLQENLNLSKAEIDKLKTFQTNSRMFLIKQNNYTIAAELSIGGLVGIVRMLSAGPEELVIYQQIREKYPGEPNDWLVELHEALDS